MKVKNIPNRIAQLNKWKAYYEHRIKELESILYSKQMLIVSSSKRLCHNSLITLATSNYRLKEEFNNGMFHIIIYKEHLLTLYSKCSIRLNQIIQKIKSLSSIII
jgi:hypothetical protein